MNSFFNQAHFKCIYYEGSLFSTKAENDLRFFLNDNLIKHGVYIKMLP